MFYSGNWFKKNYAVAFRFVEKRVHLRTMETFVVKHLSEVAQCAITCSTSLVLKQQEGS